MRERRADARLGSKADTRAEVLALRLQNCLVTEIMSAAGADEWQRWLVVLPVLARLHVDDYHMQVRPHARFSTILRAIVTTSSPTMKGTGSRSSRGCVLSTLACAKSGYLHKTSTRKVDKMRLSGS